MLKLPHNCTHLHASKVMLKILQARLQQYMNHELPDVQARFRKGRGTRDRIDNIHWIIKKAREFQKNIYFCFINYTKAVVWITINCGKFWKRWAYQTTWPASWEIWMQVRKQQLELDMEIGSKLVPNWERSTPRLPCHPYCPLLSPCLFNLYAEYIMQNARLDEAQAGIRLLGEISVTSDT